MMRHVLVDMGFPAVMLLAPFPPVDRYGMSVVPQLLSSFLMLDLAFLRVLTEMFCCYGLSSPL